MDINHYFVDGLLSVKVIPQAKENKITKSETGLKVYLQAVPEKNKGNRALINFFKKEFGLKIKIVQGLKSRKKQLRIIK